MNYDIVEVLIDKLVRTFRLRDWQYDIEDIVEDVAEGLKLIGAAKVYQEEVGVFTVNSKVIKLPRECQHIMEVDSRIPYKESGRFLILDLPDGTLVGVRYQAMPTDARGFPVIPDNAAVREALMWYLVKNLTLQGEIKKVNFQMAEQEWQWRCGSARGELNVMDVQAWSGVSNDFYRLNPIKDQHLKGYAEVGKPNTLDRNKTSKHTK